MLAKAFMGLLKTTPADLRRFGISNTEYNNSIHALLKLHFSEIEAKKIILRYYSKTIVDEIIISYKVLNRYFTNQQITKIAARQYGAKCLQESRLHFKWLKSKGFSTKDVVLISAQDGSYLTVPCLKENYSKLRDLPLTNEQITYILSHNHSASVINAILRLYPLLKDLNYNTLNITRIASKTNSKVTLETVASEHETLDELGYSIAQITNIAACPSGCNNLLAVIFFHDSLTQKGYTTEDIARMASFQNGDKNLEKVSKYHDVLSKRKRREQIVDMTSNANGSKKIEKYVLTNASLIGTPSNRQNDSSETDSSKPSLNAETVAIKQEKNDAMDNVDIPLNIFDMKDDEFNNFLMGFNKSDTTNLRTEEYLAPKIKNDVCVLDSPSALSSPSFLTRTAQSITKDENCGSTEVSKSWPKPYLPSTTVLDGPIVMKFNKENDHPLSSFQLQRRKTVPKK